MRKDVSVTRTQPVNMKISTYTIKSMKQEAINEYFKQMIDSGELSLSIDTTENDDVIQIKVSIK